MTGESDMLYLLTSDAGYGFMVRLEDLFVKSKSGKSVLTVPKAARVLPPARVADAEEGYIAAVSSGGRLLVTDIVEFPVLPRGKGLKIMQIPPSKQKSREEYVAAITTFKEGDSLTLLSGKRHLTLKPSDIDEYYGERGRRGNPLPRGFRQVSAISRLSADDGEE